MNEAQLRRNITKKEDERRVFEAERIASEELLDELKADSWPLLDRVLDAAFPEGFKVPTDPVAAAVTLGELRGILRHVVEARAFVEHDQELARQINDLHQKLNDNLSQRDS